MDTLFEFKQIEIRHSQHYFTIFLPQEAGAFQNNRERTAKATPKFEKNCILDI